MPSQEVHLVEKVHPTTREILPDDPLEMQAFEVPGDPELMLRVVAEEYARMGASADDIMQLARNPFYQGLYGLWLRLGDAEMHRRLKNVLQRCGVIRTKVVERTEPPETVQIRLSTAD